MPSTLILLAIAPTTLGLFQESTAAEARVFSDPAPPQIHKLPSIESPEPAPFGELVIHRPPGAFAEDAVIEDWPGFLGPRRDAHVHERPLALAFGDAGPALVWEMRRGEGFASPAIAGNRLVYTHRLGDEAVVECLEPETGRRYWRTTWPSTYRGRYIQDGGPRATPQIVGEHVFVHGVEGTLACLELATGRVLWKRHTSKEFGVGDDFFGVVSSPLAYGEFLIQNIGGPNGPCVAAFDRLTGKLVWGAGTDWGPSCAAPVFGTVRGEERLFVLAGGQSRPPTGGLLVLDPARRAVEFAHPFRSRTYESVNGSSPVLCGDRVFLSSSYGVGSTVLEAGKSGWRELWSDRHIGLQFSTAVYEDGLLWAIDGVSGRVGALVALDPANGKELSRTDLTYSETFEHEGETITRDAKIGEGSLLHADGHFLVLGDGGHLLTVAATRTSVRVIAKQALFHAPHSWTPPVVSGGLLYVCQNTTDTVDGTPPRLLCYDLRR